MSSTFDARPVVDALTAEQSLAMLRYGVEWSAAEWFTAGRVDRLSVDEALCRLYSAIGLDEPQIFWCQSPFQLITMPMLVRIAQASKLSPNQRWGLFSNAKLLQRKKKSRDSMTELWANFNAQVDRSPPSGQLGNLVGNRVTNYLYSKTIPRIGNRFGDVFAPVVQELLDRSLRSRLRASFGKSREISGTHSSSGTPPRARASSRASTSR